jgi:molybdenum cofactor biosynthesis enzyme MoaA
MAQDMIDKKYLNLFKNDKSSWIDTHCVVPFKNIMINSKGDLYSCWCEAWLPKSIGNISQLETWEDFDNLFKNNPVRDSIIDRSHRFCKGNICTSLQNEFNGIKSNTFVNKETLEKSDFTILRLALDSSCNLHCPTCRHGVIINHRSDFVNDLRDKMKRIDNIFFNPRRVSIVFIDGVGEFLASKTLFSWMLSKADTGISFWLQTNGTLISQYKEKLKMILAATSSINVSIDASCREVFEITRRGGNWDKLIEGLTILNELREESKFKIKYNFTISNLNYFDVPAFVKFCEEMQPDGIFFSKVEKWEHLSDDNWENLNVFSTNHPNYQDMIDIISKVTWPKNAEKNFTYKM